MKKTNISQLFVIASSLLFVLGACQQQQGSGSSSCGKCNAPCKAPCKAPCEKPPAPCKKVCPPPAPCQPKPACKPKCNPCGASNDQQMSESQGEQAVEQEATTMESSEPLSAVATDASKTNTCLVKADTVSAEIVAL